MNQLRQLHPWRPLLWLQPGVCRLLVTFPTLPLSPMTTMTLKPSTWSSRANGSTTLATTFPLNGHQRLVLRARLRGRWPLRVLVPFGLQLLAPVAGGWGRVARSSSVNPSSEPQR